jgi:hypothetical protein
MYIGRLLSFSTALVLGLCPLLAQSIPDTTITANITGTIGKILSGSDPLALSGQSGVVTVMVSESLSPTKTTANSATYTLPPGAITLTFDTTTYTTTSASTMKITLPANGPDVLVLTASIKDDKLTVSVVGTIDLKHGSFKASVLDHPAPFKPSPQTLTTATSTTGTGSKLQYTFFGSTTVLGLSGTASDSAAQDPVLPEDDESDR